VTFHKIDSEICSKSTQKEFSKILKCPSSVKFISRQWRRHWKYWTLKYHSLFSVFAINQSRDNSHRPEKQGFTEDGHKMSHNVNFPYNNYIHLYHISHTKSWDNHRHWKYWTLNTIHLTLHTEIFCTWMSVICEIYFTA
jgi:hypothetical protein